MLQDDTTQSVKKGDAMLPDLIIGLILTALAFIGFLFNIYIVLALVLTKQVLDRNSWRTICTLIPSIFLDLEAQQSSHRSPGTVQQCPDTTLSLFVHSNHPHVSARRWLLSLQTPWLHHSHHQPSHCLEHCWNSFGAICRHFTTFEVTNEGC